MTLFPYSSIITINVNELNFPIKRYRVAGWITKEDPTACCLKMLTSALHISSKQRDGKGYSMPMETRRDKGSLYQTKYTITQKL